jgi:hypothetical protein
LDVLVGPIPEIGYDVPSAGNVASITGRDVNEIIAPSIIEFQTRIEAVTEVFDALMIEDGLIQVNPAEVICSSDYCLVSAQGNLLYRDGDHLSTFGSKYVAKIFNEAFSGIKSSH